MILKPENRYYQITLEHYGTPAFCSFDKQYAGTMEMLLDFIDALEQDEDASEYEKGIIDAFHRYRQGYHDASAFVAQGERRLIHQVSGCEVLHKEVAPFDYVHTNVWGFPYYISSEKMTADLVYLRRGNQYMRYVKASFEAPKYGTTKERCNKPLGGSFWGHPGILTADDDLLHNRLMFCDCLFETEANMRDDIADPSDIDFTEFFSDIFGDG